MLLKALTRVIELSEAANAEVKEQKKSTQQAGDFVMENIFRDKTPSEAALKDFLGKQSVATLYGLVAVMYAGRDDFPITEWSTHYEQMRTTFRKPAYAISQMLGKGVSLTKYMKQGLAYLQGAAIDVDSLLDA